jgi:hypothetical protein
MEYPFSVVQFETADSGRRVGVIWHGGNVVDVTSVNPHIQRVTDAYAVAAKMGKSVAWLLDDLAGDSTVWLDYAEVRSCRSLADGPVLRPPVDLADPYHVLIAGTGLTHLGSMQSRDQMHVAAKKSTAMREPPKTDSRKMFELGLAGGRPASGKRGVAPEWFYKGNGTILRGHNEPLDIPDFTHDGGEEPEIVGCYIINDAGRPVRLGFALGNEWSDHAVEKQNYLYLAPSKLRTCAVGPELVIGNKFQEIELSCEVLRKGKPIYESGTLWSGEKHMCHSLANLEDHHFKYPQHRRPGDVHLYFFGTSKLSYGTRDWEYRNGDEIRIGANGFSAPLVNVVRKSREVNAPARAVRA